MMGCERNAEEYASGANEPFTISRKHSVDVLSLWTEALRSGGSVDAMAQDETGMKAVGLPVVKRAR